MKKLLVFAAIALLSIALAGCNGNSSPGAQEPGNTQPVQEEPETKVDPLPLELTEAGSSAGSNGFVHYGIGVKNPNKQYEARFYTVQVTGKDADDKVVFADEQVMMSILPGETQYIGMQAGNGTMPAKVEFSVTVADSNWVETDRQAQEYYKVGNTNFVPNGANGGSFTGEITQQSEIDSELYTGTALVSVILRDADGNIVFGTNGYVGNLAVGKATAFEVPAYSDTPAFSTYEFHIIPW